MRLYNHYTQSKAEEKGSFNASKGQLENFKKWTSLHNMKRTDESASADHVASTRYAAHFKKIIEDYILQQILELEARGLKFKHEMQAVMAP